MSDLMFSACADHQGLKRMEFWRALDIAKDCEQCYVELAE
jgi:putative heme iron utilization protein